MVLDWLGLAATCFAHTSCALLFLLEGHTPGNKPGSTYNLHTKVDRGQNLHEKLQWN